MGTDGDHEPRREPSPAFATGWHISAWVDLSAYALSWLWVLVPLLLLGPLREDYLLLYLLVIAITDLHRHFGLARGPAGRGRGADRAGAGLRRLLRRAVELLARLHAEVWDPAPIQRQGPGQPT